MSLQRPPAALYNNRAWPLRALGRYDEAKAASAHAHAQQVDNQGLRTNVFQIAFAEGDRALMQQQLDWAKGKSTALALASLEVQVGLFEGRRSLDALEALPGRRGIMMNLAANYAALGACDEVRTRY